VEIFKRLGTLVLDINYFEPPMVQGMPIEDQTALQGVEPDPMLFYLTPFDPTTPLTQREIAQMVVGVLVDNYRLSEDSWYVQQVLKALRSKNDG